MGGGERGSPRRLLTRFSDRSLKPPLGDAICALCVRKRAGWGRGGRLPGKEGREKDRKHLEVTSAVSSSLFGHFPLLANKSSVELET